MFGFKAHFWNESVFIGGQSYLSNEILTTLLNSPAKDLEKTLTEMRKLRHKVQLEEGGNMDFCESYDGNVQSAQNYLYYVGNIAKTIPPYNRFDLANILDTPLLFDCPNKNFIYWEDGEELQSPDDPRYKDEDYSNEFGFVTKNDIGNYSFYNHHFTPEWDTLDNPDGYVTLAIQKTNDAVCKLSDGFIAFLEDMLRVQTAYAELLEKHVHAKRKFLSDSETAECFTRYLQATEKKGSV